MVFGLGCQRERLYKPLYVVHVFILAGVVYYYFQGSVGKPAPDHEIAGEPSQLVGESLRPVWGPMDKCYPVTTQRRRVKSRKKPVSEAVPPKAKGGLNGAAPEGETDILSQREGEAAGPGPAGKEVAEEEEVAGVPGWEENTQVRKEIAVYASEASEMESKEGRPGGWVPQLLRKLWLDWFPAPDIPKTQNHE
ncbi:uncharacterized protein LOC111097639 isoform X1 [Canis lupus familiaris]|uniref:uncharacterized protein LOC111097639 isoform X1 n=1 Tax=Canis lupus familiaris TaxID=9615 RepID=UPI0018F3B10F|nr:uncharacterized protein LOC111097639 isoform X1 [Canis lupus familiaris]XP_038493731.1 uncharacterized protein LOC111097639 isoform X1 [Canis lupus familiaris]XP_038493739.1 uncharacterized protein LOC111097639 isoform X1 [Canis lupus familiaris]XP_038493745.1 uncharacterized protein LOC111097639 isoform X1 [Canis lupus familiaris]XP_038493754.1 uncharacterized protein LOC111097639 isoform X1 [Canis lupus familiaris]XP_038493763.1 uncharacterized protein LOC111097639 isoform X1 [Canis lupus